MLSNVKIPDSSTHDVLSESLRAIRLHLGMDVAFISEFSDDQRAFRYVDAAGPNAPIKAGDSGPVEEGYCQRVVDGRLPELIRDASRVPAALELPVTMALPVGAHLSVPIRLKDGRVYGTFCCFSSRPDESLSERDLAMMRVFADFAARQIEQKLVARKSFDEATDRIKSVLGSDGLSIVYQPIFHFGENKIIGFESLSRISATPYRSPDLWFNEAAAVGLGTPFETLAVKKALKGLKQLPHDIYLSVNVSPETIASGPIGDVLFGAPLERIVLEVTEHSSIDDYSELASALEPLRKRGLLLAVDDAGAGYASFRHILQLSPDLIKLDISLVRGIDRDRTRRALASALVRFAEEIGSRIVAEGVETTAELAVLRHLGVSKAQGYLIGRPMPMANALSLLQPVTV
jgi:EAL domain-containing protein (putative c-di-GMP-specific phosphodiesterase class I)